MCYLCTGEADPAIWRLTLILHTFSRPFVRHIHLVILIGASIKLCLRRSIIACKREHRGRGVYTKVWVSSRASPQRREKLLSQWETAVGYSRSPSSSLTVNRELSFGLAYHILCSKDRTGDHQFSSGSIVKGVTPEFNPLCQSIVSHVLKISLIYGQQVLNGYMYSKIIIVADLISSSSVLWILYLVCGDQSASQSLRGVNCILIELCDDVIAIQSVCVCCLRKIKLYCLLSGGWTRNTCCCWWSCIDRRLSKGEEELIQIMIVGCGI